MITEVGFFSFATEEEDEEKEEELLDRGGNGQQREDNSPLPTNHSPLEVHVPIQIDSARTKLGGRTSRSTPYQHKRN